MMFACCWVLSLVRLVGRGAASENELICMPQLSATEWLRQHIRERNSKSFKDLLLESVACQP